MSEVNLGIEPGKYIAAVSGGVDSMVLLDLLSKQRGVEIVVAHFNHGIRPDSSKDELLVAKMAKKYNLPMEAGHGRLGANTSEDQARKARYAFLHSVARKQQAEAILTAHHQDDLIETALINLIRGTGRRGLSAIAVNPDVRRPLLNYPKRRLLSYARKNRLVWSEDSTNKNDDYLRNYLRNQILPKLSKSKRANLLKISDKVANNSKAQDELIAIISHNLTNEGHIDRHKFIELPAEVADELLVYWLRDKDYLSYQRDAIDRLNTVIRTAKPATRHSVGKDLELVVDRRSAYFARVR